MGDRDMDGDAKQGLQRVTCSFVGHEHALDDFAVAGFEGAEALNLPYRYTIDLLRRDETVDAGRLLGREATLTLERDEHFRPVHGVIERVRVDERNGDGIVTVVLVPALVVSRYTTSTRIFQNLTALDIVEQVLTEDLGRYGRSLETRDLDRTRFTPRDYCVQYRETNLDFVHRLIEEEGVGYYFQAGDTAEILVLFEETHSLAAVEAAEPGPVQFEPRNDDDATAERVYRFTAGRALTTGSITVRDHDWTRGLPRVEASKTGKPSAETVGERYDHGQSRGVTIHEDPALHAAGTAGAIAAAIPNGMPIGLEHRVHDLPGAMLPPWTSDDAAKQASIRHQQMLRDRRAYQGAGRVTGFMPGKTFELVGELGVADDVPYLLTEVMHRARASTGADGHRTRVTYTNEFACLDATTPWRPDRITQKPRIPGVQTAKVTGPFGTDVHTDPLGRIKVIFNWDRASLDLAGNHTCWLRVSQVWAGQGAPGFSFIPRVGMEVVVSFVDGDPDRPIVIGCVNNGANPTPGMLPVQATKSIIRTRTVPHGTGHNELSFEDAQGMERVHLRAERDLEELVLNDHLTTVGRSQANRVVGDQVEEVGRDQQLYVHRDRKIEVGGSNIEHVASDANRTVEGSEHVWVGDDYNIDVRRGIYQVEVHCGECVLRSRGPIRLEQGDDERFIELSSDDEAKGILIKTEESFAKFTKDEIEIKIGNSFIRMREQAIQINGKTFPSGGGAGS